MTPPNFNNIPTELTEKDRWVVWRSQVRKHKLTKVPYCASTGEMASTTDPATWSSFSEAVNAYQSGHYSGAGFVFTLEDDIVGIDLDKCRDHETGKLDEIARQIVTKFDSYTEISPSGRGLHIFVRGLLPPGPRRRKTIEMYDSARYFTVTGERLDGTPARVQERNAMLSEFHAAVFGTTTKALKHVNQPLRTMPDDEALLTKAGSASNGAKFRRLWAGDWAEYSSQSEADMALSSILAFWTGGDSARVDGLFRRSGLYRPKWDERHSSDGRTYGAITVDNAVSSVTEAYKGEVVPAVQEVAVEAASLPEIVVSDKQLPDVTAEVITAMLVRNEPPTLFVRSNGLCRLQVDEDNQPSICLMDEWKVRNEVARSAYFLKRTRDGWTNVPPPMEAVRNVMAEPNLPFPVLKGLVQTPVMTPDGTILSQPGYDPKTKLFYAPPVGFIMPELSLEPSDGERERALKLVQESIFDFPFADDASKANAIALMITPMIRPAIEGPVPLALINSPKQGTGKSLLTRLIAMIATGQDAQLMTAPNNEDEWRKQVTAMLMGGKPIIGIDNVEGVLNSAALAGALTTTTWSDRILGKTQMVAPQQRAVWICTGNNIVVGGDLGRRCYSIRLDAKTERPWMGRQFKHANLIQWAQKQRGQLLWALLTMARGWYAAGKPAYEVPVIGTFEDWAVKAGSVVTHAGIKGFLRNLDETYENADQDGPQWEYFLESWYNSIGTQEITTADVVKKIGLVPTLRDAVPDTLLTDLNDSGRLRLKLGQALARKRDAQHGEYKLQKCGKDGHTKAVKWAVIKKDESEPLAGAAEVNPRMAPL